MLNIIYDASIVTNIFYKNDNRSGIFFVGLNILNELANRRDVNVMLYFSPDVYSDGVRLKEEFYPNLDCIQDLSKLSILCKLHKRFRHWYDICYRHLYLRKFFALGLMATGAFFKAKININEKKAQIATAFFSPVFKIPLEIRAFPHIKNFIYLHDAIPFVKPELNPYGKRFITEIINSTQEDDFFFFNSTCSQNDFKKIAPTVIKENSAVIPLAARLKYEVTNAPETMVNIRRKYHIPEGKKYVFSLCTLEPRKNLLRAVKAFIYFVKKYKLNDIVWLMGGSAWVPFMRTLKKETSQWKEAPIIFAGYVDDEDLPLLYGNAEWFVYTSQYEGFGLPPLEAMQCGCPVITSNNSSLPEVVGDAGLMIDWDSEEQHVEAYVKYYFKEKLRKEYGQRGLERANLFSWKNTTDMILNKISLVVKEH